MKPNLFANIVTPSIFLLCFALGWGQTGTVKYKNDATLSHYMLQKQKSDPVSFQRFRPAAELTKEYNSNISYTMQFKDSLSVFKADPLTETQGKDRLYGQIKDNKHVYYYCGPKQERFFLFKDHLVKYPKIKWKINGGTKTIKAYKCKKATAILTFYEGPAAEAYQSKVVAWFAPELPFAFGPEGYGGLPGLILELKEPENTFVAETITIPDPNVNFSWPEVTDIMPQKELIKKAREKSKY